MKEELIISGRDLPGIDPHLHIWHWPIYIDLFMGGLAAGILFFAAYYTLVGKEKEMPATVKWASFVAPLAIGVALICLFIDLKHKMYFWRLYTTFRIESPMSFGSWVILFITPLSILWSLGYIRELVPRWNHYPSWFNRLETWINNNRKLLAWPIILLAGSLGVYTGILLSAFNARPLWNTSLLGPLFLTYGLLTGAAVIMWMARNQKEKRLFIKISMVLSVLVLFFIVHLFMGFLAGPAVQVEAAELFIRGEYALPFWGFVVGLGLILPVILEFLSLQGWRIPLAIPAIFVLAGGFLFRMFIVQAGELTRYLY